MYKYFYVNIYKWSKLSKNNVWHVLLLTLRATNHNQNYTGVLAMANHSLPYFSEGSHYQIALQELEEIHFKISQSHAVLSILSDWITECENCSLPLQQKIKVDFVLYLLVTLMERVKELLPDV